MPKQNLSNLAPTLIENSKLSVSDSFSPPSFDSTMWAPPNQNGGKTVVGNGDIITIEGNTAALSWLAISKSPLVPNSETRITSAKPSALPFRLRHATSMSQRGLGQTLKLNIVSEDASVQDPPLAISSISQSTTTLTIGTNAPHNLNIGDRFDVYGVTDTRFNYPKLTVASVPTSTTLTATAGAFGTLPSVTATPAASGFIVKSDPLEGAKSGVGTCFEGSTATNCAFYVRADGEPSCNPSGTLAGAQQITCGSTASVQLVNSANAYAFGPTTETTVWSDYTGLYIIDNGPDLTTAASLRYKKGGLVPRRKKENYFVRAVYENAPNLSYPVAKIVSATKSGSTTATIVTDVPHGLTTSSYVRIYGNRDQTNFANLTTDTVVASVVDATTFTIAYGASTTAVTYGGFVVLCNGGTHGTMPGLITQAIQSISATNNILSVVGNASWTGLVIGDFVNLHGVRINLTGADLGIDGAYRVSNIATTTLTLEPIYSAIMGGGSPLPVGPVVGTFGSVNCGGSVIVRSTARFHYVYMEDYTPLYTESAHTGRRDAACAQPVSLVDGTITTLGTVTTVTGVTTVTTVSNVTNAGTPTAPATPYFVNSANSTNGALILIGTSGLQAFFASNSGGTPAYVKLYNKATAPTVGTDIPEMVITVPANGQVELTPGFNGYRFPLGLGIAITGGAADADTTAVAAGQVKVKLSRTV